MIYSYKEKIINKKFDHFSKDRATEGGLRSNGRLRGHLDQRHRRLLVLQTERRAPRSDVHQPARAAVLIFTSPGPPRASLRKNLLAVLVRSGCRYAATSLIG